MIISDIKRQKKRDQRFSIFLDGAYSFSIDELELSASSLRVGGELTEHEAAEWREHSSLSIAYDNSLRFLSYRQRSEREIRTFLLNKDFDDETIRLTLHRLIDLKMVNDETFARSWVADRNRMRPRSKQMLTMELRQKGIDSELISFILDEVDHDTEVAVLRRLIERKAMRYSDDTKLIVYLSSLGYKYGLIKEAMASESDKMLD
jgi:regulatory protein